MVWSVDLGTTNTGVCRWDVENDAPRLVSLPQICRETATSDPLQAPRLVPSATHVSGERSLGSRLSNLPFFRGRYFWGKHAWIGRQALERNQGTHQPAFAPSFKGLLGSDPLRILARSARQNHTVREVAQCYIRELVGEVKRVTGERMEEVVVTAPVEAFEHYRAEVARLFKQVGVSTVRFTDEPVAAAIGYGLGIKRSRHVLVVDFGGGTLDLAMVNLTASDFQRGTCHVIAKEGRPIGGNLVDQWLLEEFCQRLDYPLATETLTSDRDKFWYQMLLDEARRVKEAVFFGHEAVFTMTPPEEMRRFEAQIRGEAPDCEVSRGLLENVLEKRGLWDQLASCLQGVRAQAAAVGGRLDEVEDVLLVGGSTLLPGVFQFFESRFGRGRVRAWQPFEAVAFGACAFAADRYDTHDFIVHDYGILTHDKDTGASGYQVVIPRGTRVPTGPGIWKRQLVPTCALGEPESVFKLVIAELGRHDDGQGRFERDGLGQLRPPTQGQAAGEVVVALNASSPTLGTLDPPHAPSETTPRLEVSFGVSAERWLEATVTDLKTQKLLMDRERIVRLV